MMNVLKAGIIFAATGGYATLITVLFNSETVAWLSLLAMAWAIWTSSLLILGLWELLDRLDKHLGGNGQ